MKTIHVYNRGDIMRRAHQIARETREETARRAYAADATVVCGRPSHSRAFKTFLAETPTDFSAAMKAAWAEAKRANDQPAHSGALAVVNPARGPLALAGERLRSVDLAALFMTAARFLDRHLIPTH